MSEPMKRIVDIESVKPYRSPQQRKQLVIAAVVVVAVAVLGVGAYFAIVPRKQTYTLRGYETAKVTAATLTQTTQASGTVAIPVQMSLASPEEGYAATIAVVEGDTVKKGQILARITVPDLQNDLEDLQVSLEDAQRTYEKTVAQDKITADRKVRELATLDQDIAVSQAARDRTAKLVAAGGTPQSDLDTAQKALDKLIASKKESQLQLEEDQRLAELDEQSKLAAIADLKTSIRRLQERIAATTITSPMNGEVLAVDSALAVPGSLIVNGTSLFTIADPASAIVELEVLEQYSGLLSIGQQVKLTVGSSTLTGRITSIGKVAQQSSDGLGATVEVKVKPEGFGSASLLQGNTAVGEITLGTKENVLQIPRGPYLTTGSQRYLYKVEGKMARRVAVTFGTMEGNTVEILSGVEAGDVVITSGYQNFIEYEEINLEGGST